MIKHCQYKLAIRNKALTGLKFSEDGDSISTTLVKTNHNGQILWAKPYKEMIIEGEESEVCLVSSLLQIPSGDYILSGVVLTLSEYAGGIIDTDFWIGFVIQNIDQISGWEFSPFLIALCVLSIKLKKKGVFYKRTKIIKYELM
jgi:hypothetical protein